jgi:hypothetical protein
MRFPFLQVNRANVGERSGFIEPSTVANAPTGLTEEYQGIGTDALGCVPDTLGAEELSPLDELSVHEISFPSTATLAEGYDKLWGMIL